jgi:hypothetical protein
MLKLILRKIFVYGGIEFVVSDDYQVLKRVIDKVILEAAGQGCYVHFLINALDHLPPKPWLTVCRSCGGSMIAEIWPTGCLKKSIRKNPDKSLSITLKRRYNQ